MKALQISGMQRIATFLFICLLVALYGAATADETVCISLSRTVSVSHYESEQEIVVELAIQNTCDEALSSLGISESLPADWQFIAGETISGASPVQWLAPGSVDKLEIFWITVPVFPVVLRYTVKAAEAMTTPAAFSGYAVFSFSTGNQQISNPVETTLPPAIVAEGEGETVEGEQREGEGETEGETVEGEQEGELLLEGEPVEGEKEGETIEDEEGEGENEASVGCCRRQYPNQTARGLEKRFLFAGDALLFFGSLLFFVV